jgi:hypothetical protein
LFVSLSLLALLCVCHSSLLLFLSTLSLSFVRPPGALAGEMRCPLPIWSSILIYLGVIPSFGGPVRQPNVHEQQGPPTCSARSDHPCPVGNSSIYSDECVRARIPLSRRAAVFDRATSAIRLCVGEDRIGGETDPLGASFLCAQACSLQAGTAMCTWETMAYAANEVGRSSLSLSLPLLQMTCNLRFWAMGVGSFFSFPLLFFSFSVVSPSRDSRWCML